MAKSRAEIQKAYRERQKAKGPAFLQKERQRAQSNYVPAASMNKRKLTERNHKAKLRNRLSRLKKKEQQQNIDLLNESDTNVCTSGYGSMDHGLSDRRESDPGPSTRSTPSATPLIVKLPNYKQTKKGSGLKKTKKRALARARKSIKKMEDEIKSLKKKLKTKSKQIERMRTKVNKKSGEKNLTPRKETDNDISELQLTPRRKEKIRRKLILGNAVLQEINDSKKCTTRKSRSLLHNIVAGRVTRKYRLLSEISKSTGLSRNSLYRCKYKKLEKYIEKRKSLTKTILVSVHEFLQREDNCRIQPGKSDSKKDENGDKRQTAILTDYMSNLHAKYLSENPETKVSFASFCRMRPKNVLLASFISRNACQCIRHQNIALKVQSLRKLGADMNKNPENALKEMNNFSNTMSKLPDEIPYKVWKKVPLENGVHKMRIVEETKDKEAFSLMFQAEMADFSEHVERVKQQFFELRRLKESLPEHEFILQMDFAENFSCRSLDEVQTAYWNQTAVTLHPVVMYYRKDETLKHKSLVIISDETNHSASTVCAFLDVIVPRIKELDTQVKNIHYWTDSPSSQYRNRFVFETIAKHETIYGMKAIWNYFEAGHGKGPCDGLGGTTKRLADEAVRQGKVEIQDAKDFYEWASKSNMKEVDFVFVGKDICEKKKTEIKNEPIKPVKDTMKLHAVVGISENAILIRVTSCYCELCMAGMYCNTWVSITLQRKAKRPRGTAMLETVENIPVADKETVERGPERQERHEESLDDVMNPENISDLTSIPMPAAVTPESSAISFAVGSFVACAYSGHWYIGQITDIDEEDKELEVNFMERSKNLYRWPNRKDQIWVPYSDVLCEISQPIPSGKSARNFILDKFDRSKIESKFTG